MKVTAIKLEHHFSPSGIDESTPRLSWTVTHPPAGWEQASFELMLEERAKPPKTMRLANSSSQHVAWPFDPLVSRTEAAVRVRVWGINSGPSEWSEPTHLSRGLDAHDWVAVPVGPPVEHLPLPRPAYLLRKLFTLAEGFDRATVYSTAHGIYELEINGRRVGSDTLAPGWTSYGNRLRFQTNDVTSLLQGGENAIGVWLADGWFRGQVGYLRDSYDVYGDRTSGLVQLEVDYPDGHRTTISSDGSWRTRRSAITSTGLYEGEAYDARDATVGFTRPGFDSSSWLPVEVLQPYSGHLVAPTGGPITEIETIAPVLTTIKSEKRQILDFGQNVSGRLRIRMSGSRGQLITLRHSEVLDADGELAVGPLRTADATDRYTLDGSGVEVWEPRFSIHGFRFAEISVSGPPLLDFCAEAVVVHSEMRRSGWFHSSNSKLNRLHENVVWSMRDNFVDIPTDCPQRDERLGWTGDIQLFAPSALFLFDCAGLLTSWLRDLEAEQSHYGYVPHYVPYVELGHEPTPAAGWGDAAVIVPWTIYERTGDLEILTTQYESMCAWVDDIVNRTDHEGLWTTGFQFGDWLDPTAEPDSPNVGRTNNYLVANAYFVHSTRLLAATASLLGRLHDASKYATLVENTVRAFRRTYLLSDGTLISDSPTAYSVALKFDLLPPEFVEFAGERLAQLVRADQHRIGTGILGTSLVCDALWEAGFIADAYALVLQEEHPSWLYALSHDATTIWERWDSLRPDGSMNSDGMTSFNHYALGAIADFLHRKVGGLSPAGPGYREILVSPQPGGGLTSAESIHETPYGTAEVRWSLSGDVMELHVVIPVGSTATVVLPNGETIEKVSHGEHDYSCKFTGAKLRKEMSHG